MKKIFNLFSGIVLLLGILIFTNSIKADTDANPQNNITICHRNGGSGNYNQITVNANGSVDGHAGDSHQNGGDIIPSFYWQENGNTNYFPGQNWNAQGQEIWNNNCEISRCNPTPTPSATPSPTPSPSVSPTPTPTPSPSASPSPTPPVCQQQTWTCAQCMIPLSNDNICARDQKNYCEQTYDCHMDEETRIVTCYCPTPEPSPSPTPQLSKSAHIGYDISCTRSYFIATLDLSENGNWLEGIKVTFKYNGTTKEDYTDAQGRARVEFNIDGEHPLTASADGFDTQSIDIKVPICDGSEKNEDNSSGQVLGTNTDTPRQGQVLGASTLADTGTSDRIYWMMIIAGAVLSISAGLSYVKSK